MAKRRKKQHSKYRGVCFHVTHGRWYAQCRPPHGKLKIKYARTEVEAARKYDQMAVEYHKGNAILNFPRDDRE